MRENSNLLEIDMGDLYCLNVGWGDASIVKTDTATFLVDCNGIEDHSVYLPADKKLRGVFITHQHSDHYSGLNYLKDNNYQIDFLIYSPYDRRYGDTSVTLDEWDEFNTLKDHFVSKGTELRSPFRQDNWEKAWWNQLTVNFWIIGPSSSVATADTREIHDASLVIKADLGSRACLFAGDASDVNLENIAVEVTNYCNDILHASHHGSINGAELSFIKGCNAKYTLISTQTGVYDNAPHPTALKRYSDNTVNDVRRTDIDGTWNWTF
jgi:beta-lactamase superfamily II metal-dependent hydrolase